MEVFEDPAGFESIGGVVVEVVVNTRSSIVSKSKF
jgi:hypothetical protein